MWGKSSTGTPLDIAKKRYESLQSGPAQDVSSWEDQLDVMGKIAETPRNKDGSGNLGIIEKDFKEAETDNRANSQMISGIAKGLGDAMNNQNRALEAANYNYKPIQNNVDSMTDMGARRAAIMKMRNGGR